MKYGNLSLLALVVIGFGVTALAEVGCHRQDEQRCVPIDPSLDYEGAMQGRPYCQWEPGELPEPPEGYAKTHRVFVAFEPTDDQPCDSCDVERFEALLHEEIEGLCSSLDYTGLFVACYIPPGESGDSCWVAGIYFSNFAHVPFDHGCHQCLPGESLCNGPLER